MLCYKEYIIARKKRKSSAQILHRAFLRLIESSSSFVLMNVSDNRDYNSNYVRKPLAKSRQEGRVIVDLTTRHRCEESTAESVSRATEVSSVYKSRNQAQYSDNYSHYLISAYEGDRVKRIHYQHIRRKHNHRNR